MLKSLCIGNFSKALGLQSEMKKPITTKVHAYKTLRKKYSVVAHLQTLRKKYSTVTHLHSIKKEIFSCDTSTKHWEKNILLWHAHKTFRKKYSVVAHLQTLRKKYSVVTHLQNIKKEIFSCDTPTKH